MPANSSGKVKTRIVHQVKKNGETYVLERKTQYDPVKKYNVVLSSRLIGKIPKGETKVVPTGHKRSPKEKEAAADIQTALGSAFSGKARMMEILDHIGTVSGIDSAVCENTDPDTALKILSIARYLCGTNRQPLSGMPVWQLSHPLPVKEELTEDVCLALFKKVGRGETSRQGFFASRFAALDEEEVLVYETAVVSAFSMQLPDSEGTYPEAPDGLPAPFLVWYSGKTRQPIAFAQESGDHQGGSTLEKMGKQLLSFGISKTEVVTDRGECSLKDLEELLYAPFNFITPVKRTVSWVRKELDSHLEDFFSKDTVCPFDGDIFGVTAKVRCDSIRPGERKITGQDSVNGEPGKSGRGMYLHLYFDARQRSSEDAAFDEELSEIRCRMEDGEKETALPESARQYFAVFKDHGKTSITLQEEAVAQAKRYHGFFCLAASGEKDAFEALRKYRGKETVDAFFAPERREAEKPRTGVCSPADLQGRLFVQFVALSYFEFYREQLRTLKQTLTEEIAHPQSKTDAEELTTKKNLLSWLQSTPVYLTLLWFDVSGEAQVSGKLKSRRWSKEIIERDQLFLESLGVPDL